ncbi:MAG: hypothetical protein OXC46_01205 [Thaumarchaeota archaeon]|nr:hypothetical protein [Nitrososphaerota archaeon]
MATNHIVDLVGHYDIIEIIKVHGMTMYVVGMANIAVMAIWGKLTYQNRVRSLKGSIAKQQAKLDEMRSGEVK